MGETQSPPKRLRSRQCMFVLYPESQETAIEYPRKKISRVPGLCAIKDVHTAKGISSLH